MEAATEDSGGNWSHGVMSAGDNTGAEAVASMYEGGASDNGVAGVRSVARVEIDSPLTHVTVKWVGVITIVRGCGKAA